MTDPDTRLAQFFASDLPLARDQVFLAEIQEKIARRTFYRDLAGLSVVSLGGAGVLWLVWPTLHSTLNLLGRGLAPGAVCVCVALSILAMASGRAIDFRT